MDLYAGRTVAENTDRWSKKYGIRFFLAGSAEVVERIQQAMTGEDNGTD